jgi:hypothetical protein
MQASAFNSGQLGIYAFCYHVKVMHHIDVCVYHNLLCASAGMVPAYAE